MMLLLCIAALLTASVKSDCSNSDHESILHTGHEYFYSFETQALGEAVGTTDDRNKLSINCEVHIRHAYECYFTLELQQCVLTAVGGSPGSEAVWIDNKPLLELSNQPVLFAIDNGKVNEFLTAEDDPVHLVNIKRGALSAFVFKLSTTVNETQELQTDVHGVCPVTSIPVNSEDGTVKTSKDMSHCAFPSRPDWQLSPWSIFWNMSFIQYVINSTTDCDYKIDMTEKRIENVFCKERHAIMLESTHRTTTAVQTNIYYSLKHLRSGLLKDTPDYSLLTHKSSIKFEYVETSVPRTSKNFMSQAKKLISDLVLDSIEEIRLFSVPQFTEFVRLLRTSPNLVPFAEIVKACSFLTSNIACTDTIKELAMSYMNDALVQCNTAPCFKAISHLAENSDLSPSYLKFVLYSWSNMHFTDPSLINPIINICRIEDMKFCWMVLGTITRRFYEWNHPAKNEIPQQLIEVANHFHNSIGENCNGPEATAFSSENYHNLLAYFNAIRNMGKIYSIIIPDGTKQIITCITKEDSPAYLRASAIQMLNSMDACHNDASCTYIYEKLLPLMLNSSLSLNIRSGAYDQLILTPEHYIFQQDLMKFFMEDDNIDLKAYVAGSLSDVLSNPQYKKTHEKFVNELKDLLEEKEVSLEAFIHNPSAKSKFSSFASFMKLPFMPEELQKFGVKYQESILFQFYNMIPKAFQSKLTMQLFNKMINVLQIGGNFEGWEGLAITIQKILQEVNPKSPSPERIDEIIKDIIRVLSEEDSVSQSNYLSDTIIENIKKIQQIYHTHSPQLKQFLIIYFEMFGSTLNFFTSDDMLSLPSKIEEIHDFLDLLSEGLVYNTTRMISVIEAYHQVPTLIGLPLNWTTDATLAFSIRRGLKMDYNIEQSEVHANGFYHPSAVLTFLNRMVLDFPTITKIGVQANSSAYTSTQWKAELHYSKDQKVFKIERPDKSQKVLELFRTNQLIRHNNAIDIVDWDIERTSSTWCYDGTLTSVLGLQLCIDKSYPKVTHLVKPWALMAGWCKWQLVINPFNEEVSAYHVEATKVTMNKSKEVELKIGTTGSSKKQEIVVAAMVDETGELKFEMNTPLSEDFAFTASKKHILENNKISGYTSLVLIKLAKDFQYKAVYNFEDKQEKRREMSSIKNKSSNKKVLTYVQEGSLELETPFNKYKWDRKVHTSGENKKADASISFENLVPYANWLKSILPPTFWQTDSKAWFSAQINWKVLSPQPSDSDIRQTSIYITTPKSSAEFLANSLKMSGRQQLTLNVTKTDTTSRKLLTFANFTYDFWSSGSNQLSSKEISMYNLTLPQRSWALQLQKTNEEDNFLYELLFTRARMESKNGGKSDYIGWWSKDQERNFDLKQHELKFKAKVHSEIVDSGDLVNRYSTLKINDVQGLKNKLITADIVLHLPIYEDVESLTFDGYFILSRGSTSFRYQKNFDLTSSYHNLKLTSHSVYGINPYQSTLSHNSFFTEMTSGKEAFNTIEYRRSYRPGTCKEIEFRHDIKSEVFDLSTNASYVCHSKNLDLHTLSLNMTTSSSHWDALNMNLIQTIKDINSELTEESVNITHPYMSINVTADWRGQEKDHTKHVMFNSLEDSIPSMELNLKSRKGVINMELTMQNSNKTKLYYEQRISSDSRNLVMKIGHSDQESEKSDAVVMKGAIINPLQRIWRGETNVVTYQKIAYFLNSAYKKYSNAFTKMAKDYDHPLNKILKPIIKMSLYDYWKNLKIEFRENVMSIWIAAKESTLMMEPVYKPAQIVVTNAFYKLMNVISQTFLAVKDKSVTIWAINYFHIPSYIQKYFNNLPQNIREMSTWFLPEDNIIKFEFDANKLVEWGSFKEWPTFSTEQARIYFPFFFPEKEPEIKPRYQPADGNKVAVIFGPAHVYTFDGHLYDVPPYASDECTFLLAHDVHKSLFTVLSTANKIHVIFPEMTVTVSSKNEVYINGSNTEHLLPVEADNKKVIVKRGDFIDIWSPSLHIICDGRNFLCTLELSYWHAGGTIGLLGNADGQPHNDFILPDGHITSSLTEFAVQYELSGKPACRNLNSVHATKPSEEEKQCASQLSNACPKDTNLQKAFLEPCLTDLRNGHNTCYAASGLSALCYYKVGQGSSKCTIATQESSKIRHKLEVVLIVNQLSSMASNESKNSPYKGLESTIVALDEKFRTNGYSSVIYSLVGFGGKDENNQPSVYSIGSNPWVPLQKMVNDVLKTLKFEGTDSANNLESILYASEVLGYDTFDSKIFLMITDKDKQVAEKSQLDTIQDHLNKNGITLYTISSYPTIEKGKKVFGLRADGLLFPSPKKEDEGYLDYPKGDLAKLSAGTRGSVFLYKFIKSNSPASFFQEFAQEVWAKVRKEVHSCRKCKTVQSSWWHSFNECNIVHC